MSTYLRTYHARTFPPTFEFATPGNNFALQGSVILFVYSCVAMFAWGGGAIGLERYHDAFIPTIQRHLVAFALSPSLDFIWSIYLELKERYYGAGNTIQL